MVDVDTVSDFFEKILNMPVDRLFVADQTSMHDSNLAVSLIDLLIFIMRPHGFEP